MNLRAQSLEAIEQTLAAAFAVVEESTQIGDVVEVPIDEWRALLAGVVALEAVGEESGRERVEEPVEVAAFLVPVLAFFPLAWWLS